MGYRLTIEDMTEEASKRGGKCLSEKYINQKVKLQWQCKEGHIFWMRPAGVRNSSTWCPECVGKKKGTIGEMKRLAIEKGGKCLSNTYKNRYTKLLWECGKGHQWLSQPANLVKAGSWCPECPRGYGERITRAYFELIFGQNFPNLKPKWLRNDRGYLLQLDGYCKDLKLAFEYQGHQHYLKTHFHRTEADFEMRKRDDELKREICEKKGVSLIEVPYTVPHEKIYEFILTQCRERNISIPEHTKQSLDELGLCLPPEKIDEMRAIAATFGGKCLSSKYIGNHEKLEWACKQGHTWWAQPYSVKAGHWCGSCAGKRWLTISEMREIAQKRSGACLSKEYKGSKAHLLWQCADGHIWSAIPNSIKRGRWCPTCYSSENTSTTSTKAQLSLLDHVLPEAILH